MAYGYSPLTGIPMTNFWINWRSVKSTSSTRGRYRALGGLNHAIKKNLHIFLINIIDVKDEDMNIDIKKYSKIFMDRKKTNDTIEEMS